MDLPKFSAVQPVQEAESQAEVKVSGSQASESVFGESARGGLVALAVAAGVFNVLAVPILRGVTGDRGAALLFGPIVVGVLAGEFGAMALWFVWGEGPFLRRLAMHWGVGLLLLCGFMVGLAAVMFEEGPMWEFWWRETATVLCAVPALSLGAQLPLWPLRTHLGWSVERVGADLMARPPVALSISDILCGTAVVAVSLGLIRAAPEAKMEYFVSIGVALAFIFVASVICLVPATLFVLRSKEWPLGVGLLAGYSVLPTFCLVIFGSVMRGRGMQGEAILAMILGSFVFAATVAAPLWVMRAGGYRLVWPRDRRRV